MQYVFLASIARREISETIESRLGMSMDRAGYKMTRGNCTENNICVNNGDQWYDGAMRMGSSTSMTRP